ncbi:Hypothetical predicted protein [Paramuricea clavata]|uniref:Uncharacterized protein n=1 Tax=Paramuricea clavata TaxID=317549 RepID=A0A6S7KAM5_PARCT|nr:Hypothetical predicted protein [Paramuricea clavata]
MAAYLMSHYPSTPPTSCLIAAKSCVPPIKATTIPRLELMGAVLSTQVVKSITQILSVATVTFWTDSTNVLFWVLNQSRSFKPFVANRVGEIQRTTDPTQWRHVPGKLNPSDLPTRGVSAKDLIESKSPNEDTTSEVFMDPTKYSSLQRLVRVTVWILRFARNCKLSKERRVLSATLASEDITEAETVWLRRTQSPFQMERNNC